MIERQPELPAAGWTPRGCKTDSRPQRGWWAPGSYMNKCVECGEGFIGDKRAGSCADCAYREAAADSAKAPVESETRVRLQRAGSETPAVGAADVLRAMEEDYAAAKSNFEFQKKLHSAKFENGYKQCLDQWMPWLRLVLAESQNGKHSDTAQ